MEALAESYGGGGGPSLRASVSHLRLCVPIEYLYSYVASFTSWREAISVLPLEVGDAEMCSSSL